MNRIKKLVLGMVMMLTLLLGSNMGVLAAGTTSIAVSKASMNVGDSVTVTVQGTEIGRASCRERV